MGILLNMHSIITLLLSSSIIAAAKDECLDFTVSDCVIDPGLLVWENDQVGTSALCQFACRNFNSCKEFRFYQGNCQLFSDNFKNTCDIVGGRVDKTLEDCTGSVTVGGCDAFIDEECEYLGEDSGFSAPPGELTSAVECQDYCKGFQVLGCEYWVWGGTNQTCDLLKSSERTCWGISGPSEPSIEECRFCQEEEQQFTAAEKFDLQAPVDGPVWGEMSWPCTTKGDWNMTAGVDGSEVWRMDGACGSIALSSDFYQDVEFNGSFTNLGSDDDWIGFVFGYQDIGHFYVALSPLLGNTHTTTTPWRLTKVASETGDTSDEMMKAIMSDEDIAGQTTILLKPSDQGWQRDKVNSWRVTHRPSTSSLSISMDVDSESIWSEEWEHTFAGEEMAGRIGVFSYSQKSKFFDLKIKELCPLLA